MSLEETMKTNEAVGKMDLTVTVRKESKNAPSEAEAGLQYMCSITKEGSRKKESSLVPGTLGAKGHRGSVFGGVYENTAVCRALHFL